MAIIFNNLKSTIVGFKRGEFLLISSSRAKPRDSSSIAKRRMEESLSKTSVKLEDFLFLTHKTMDNDDVQTIKLIKNRNRQQPSSEDSQQKSINFKVEFSRKITD